MKNYLNSFLKKLLVLLVLAGALSYGFVKIANDNGLLVSDKTLKSEVKKLQAQKTGLTKRLKEIKTKYAWHRWFHSEYAAELRRTQYGEATLEINELLHKYEKEFIKIQDVTESVVCSAPTNATFDNNFIYWSARMLPLPNNEKVDFFTISYIGKAEFTYSGKSFDAFVMPQHFSKKINRDIKKHGFIEGWLKKNNPGELKFSSGGPYGNSAVFSYNSGDIDGDGRGDFVFHKNLVLSRRGYSKEIPAPRRTMFFKKTLLGLDKNKIIQFQLDGERLIEKSSIELKNAVHDNVPYVILPFSENQIAVRTQQGLDIYGVTDKITYFASIAGLVAGEVQTGAIADFDGDDKNEIWISQVNTLTNYPEKKDHLTMIDPSLVKAGNNQLNDLTKFKIFGSQRYSDYDGIGTSLSPIAGDLDGDGKPDISFTGHRHMNEAGALYIVFGKDLQQPKEISITDQTVVKILGLPMSQIAPPFHHWDAHDFNNDGFNDLVMAVDNDLCSGLHSGSVYLLSGKKITEEYQKIN